jgi:hypothetical protein
VLEAVEYGKKTGVIAGSTWLTLPNGEKFNGAPKAVEYLKEHTDVMLAIRAQVLESLKGLAHDESEDGSEDPAGIAAMLAEDVEDKSPFGVEDAPKKTKAKSA